MATEIETLVVTLEADVSKLITQVNKAIDQAEDKLEGLDDTAKDTFGKEIPKSAKKTEGAMAGVRDAAVKLGAVLATLGAAFVAAFAEAQRAISGVRVEQSFLKLANNANLAGDAILNSMREASMGTINDVELMSAALTIFNANLAKTPEEFGQIVKSATALSRRSGISVGEALERLTRGAARNEIEILDELGIQLRDINAEIDRLSRADTGKLGSQLSAAERQAYFAQAVLKIANREAAELGDNLEDVGTGIERQVAEFENLRQSVGEMATVSFALLDKAVADLFGRGQSALGRIKAAVDGLTFGATVVFDIIRTLGQEIFETGTLAIETLRAEFDLLVFSAENVGALISGDQAALDELARLSQRVADNGRQFRESITAAPDEFGERFSKNFAETQKQFQEIFDPEAAAAASGAAPGDEPDAVDPEAEKRAEAQKQLIEQLGVDLLEIQEQVGEDLANLEEENQEKLADIQEDAQEERLKAQQDYRKKLLEIRKSAEDDQIEAIEDARRDLADLARDTDKAILDEQQDFQKEERRETEDHLEEMRKMRLDYLDNLEDAVKSRDARAIVDLRKQYQRQQSEAERNFETGRKREREDQSERLNAIRQSETDRASEIIRKRDEELNEIGRKQSEEIDKLRDNLDEQLNTINQKEDEKRVEQLANYEEERMLLENAVATRLEEITKGLATEKDLNEEGAQAVLETLTEYYGEGGKIDELFAGYLERRKKIADIAEAFRANTESKTQNATNGASKAPSLPSAGAGLISEAIPFARGGTMIATQPTLAMFGEAGPERATFTPLSGGTAGGGMMTVRVEMSGSAPPGVGGNEVNQIAGVIIQALDQAGMRVSR